MTDRSSCQQDPMAPALGVVGRDSWVGGPGDYPGRFSHVRKTLIDWLDVMPN